MYNIRMVRNRGNLALVLWTAEVYDRWGFIKKRVPGYNYNRVLRKAYEWAERHGRLE